MRRPATFTVRRWGSKPDSFEVNLAYGGFNQALGRFDDAGAAYGRYLEWARKSGNADAVARALNHLAVLDNDQSRPDDARNEYQEGLQTYRRLARQNPDAYLPAVALTLNNLGNLDRDQSRPDEARKEYQEAPQIYEAAAKQNPERFSPVVAMIKKLLAQLPR